MLGDGTKLGPEEIERICEELDRHQRARLERTDPGDKARWQAILDNLAMSGELDEIEIAVYKTAELLKAKGINPVGFSLVAGKLGLKSEVVREAMISIGVKMAELYDAIKAHERENKKAAEVAAVGN